MSELPKYPVNVPDPIGDLMNDLRTRGRARLIAGWFDDVDFIEVTAEVSRQWDFYDDDVMHEELVVTLDTLETLLRWNREPKKGFSVKDGNLGADLPLREQIAQAIEALIPTGVTADSPASALRRAARTVRGTDQ